MAIIYSFNDKIDFEVLDLCFLIFVSLLYQFF